jgi:hypothetical protein
MLKIRKKKMLKQVLDDVRVKKTILTFAILIAIMIVVTNAIFAVKFFVVGKIFIGVLKVLSCLIWTFIGGVAAWIVYRDFIRKKKNV